MKHKILVILPLIISFFTSCNNNDKEIIFKKLQGDWTDKYGQNIFSFYDSSCSYIYPAGGEFSKFYISDDTICCYPLTRDKKKYSILKFKVQSINDDSMRLSFSYWDKKEETIDLVKTKNILGNEIVLDSIKLLTVSGVTYYPSMEVYINNSGAYLYKGIRDVSIIGNYTGKIEKKQMDFLEEKFRCIEYKNILSNPNKEGCFGPSTNIEIYVRNKVSDYKKSFIISNFLSLEEPAELRIFINYVMSVYKHIELKAI